MKPIADVVMADKQAESTLRTLFEDLYNRVIPSDIINKALRTGKLERPHIHTTSTGIELPYAYITATCYPVNGAMVYAWQLKRQNVLGWTTYFSVENSIKIINLQYNVTYELRVLAIGNLLTKSDWSVTIQIATPQAPKPSVVTGITVSNIGTYTDPTTGVTLASVKIEWTPNSESEMVDCYEVIWFEV